MNFDAVAIDLDVGYGCLLTGVHSHPSWLEPLGQASQVYSTLVSTFSWGRHEVDVYTLFGRWQLDECLDFLPEQQLDQTCPRTLRTNCRQITRCHEEDERNNSQKRCANPTFHLEDSLQEACCHQLA